ncbi:MAG: hypothetical protein RLY86_4059 [Pseudomonadota bacterium]|jgi:predicted transcriptional regulator
MADGGVLTIQLTPELARNLSLLASETGQNPDTIAAAAIAEHVAREQDIIAGIHRGLADVAAGNLIDHDVAMAEIDELINRIARGEA